MKLIIQIPCYNEEAILPATIQALPREISGVDVIEYLIIDDGSQDQTIRVAQELGVHHIVRLPHHRGLAAAFTAGLEASLSLGADIIVNTDADNQYYGADVPRLIQPILEGRADMVVGDRGVANLEHFSPIKRLLQRLGSGVMQALAGVKIPDAASGFRAYSREASLRVLVLSDYSYTLETLIQASAWRLALVYVPVRVNAHTRQSRLVRSIPQYLLNSALTIIHAYTMYRPLYVFMGIGLLFIGGGLLLGLRFLYFYIIGLGLNNPVGHVQSLILAAILLIIGVQVGLIGLVADLISINRRLMEMTLYRLKRLETEGRLPSSPPLPQ